MPAAKNPMTNRLLAENAGKLSPKQVLREISYAPLHTRHFGYMRLIECVKPKPFLAKKSLEQVSLYARHWI